MEWDEERIRDFLPYQTFGFAPPPRMSPALDAARADQRRKNRELAHQELRRGLEERGYTHSADAPDLVVHYWLGEASKDVYQPYGTQRQGELDVWFVDPKKETRVWGGWATLTLWEDIDGAAEIREACARLLEDVPERS